MNLLEEITKLKFEGYNEENAEARLAQDIVLYGISKSNLKRNVTIKGGVVMRNLSRNARRATQDIDFDFIKYSVSDESIKNFIDNLCLYDGMELKYKLPFVELNHQDYRGKRIYIEIFDRYGNKIESKIDIGVHKDLNIEQEEYCFDVCFFEDGANLLMNTKEQIITEKLKSFLRFGTRSTRYKDVFDIFYLSREFDEIKLKKCIKKYIYDDITLPVNNVEELISRVERVFTNNKFKFELVRSKKNWLDLNVEDVLEGDLTFINSLRDKVVLK